MIAADKKILKDSFGRQHKYLRISLTEECNFRCTYCMPEHGVTLSPKKELATSQEILSIAKTFVEHGVNKIRLTGGEPLVRKDVSTILKNLSELPVELAISTNGVFVDRFIDLFKEVRLQKINISLDSLVPTKFKHITRRDDFDKVIKNIQSQGSCKMDET